MKLCLDCRADISHRTGGAVRCLSCSYAHKKKRTAELNRLKPKKYRKCFKPDCTTEMTGKGTQQYCDDHLYISRRRRRVEKKAVAVAKVKKEPRKAGVSRNDGKPWFPGWNGCYSPNLSPLVIELLERNTTAAPINPYRSA